MTPGIRDLHHLHQRAEFFVHHEDIKEANSIEKAVDKIFKKQISTDLKIDIAPWEPGKFRKLSEKKKREKRQKWREQASQLNKMWLLQMMEPDKGLIEKMTLFWHGHFACRTIDNPYLTMEMNNLLRVHALGNFRDLLYAVSKSAAMISYLHLRQNLKGSPNEDFARELCELFTLGRDIDYTEKDVTEIARAFTGWSIDQYGKFMVRPNQHDEGKKTIFGKTGNFNGEDVLEMILENQHTADHIAKKVYRFFVREEINRQQIKELSDVLYQSNYDIEKMMRHLFTASWFYEAQGELIKSPIELVVVFGRMFDLKYPDDTAVGGIQRYLGQVLFDPPNVAGWPGGRQWIDSSRLALRLRLGSLIINRGYVMDELSPELDSMIMEKQQKRDLKFYEEVNWDAFWKKNEGANPYDLLIRSQNAVLKEKLNSTENKTIIHLLSTPDFQLT